MFCWVVACCAACSSSDDQTTAGNPVANGGTGASTAPTTSGGGQGGGPTRMGQGATSGQMTAPAGGSSAVMAGSGGAPMGGMSAGASGSGGAAGSAGDMAAAGSAGSMEVDEPCDPADKGPDPTSVEFAAPFEGPGISTPSGEFEPVMESDPGIPTHTVIRPEPLGEIKHPILAWGEGGCGKSGNIGMFTNLFREFASHGILIVADGPPGAGPTMEGTDAKPLLFAIEWAQKENERPCSQYYHKLAVNKVAVSGQSCGGLMAIQAAVDPKITTAFPYNSGLFARDQTIYDALHAPMAIFDGGSGDIAYANGMADFNAIDSIPILFANPTSCSSDPHVCTFFDANAGEFGRAGVAWMRWHLLDDQGATGKGMFIGDNCGLCGSEWNLMWKMKPQ